MDFQFLVEMAWKSALICAAALALAALLRTRSASERSALLGTAAAMIVGLPVISLLLPSLIVVTGTAHEAAAPSLGAAELAAWATKARPPSASVLDDPAPLIELLWAGGVLMVLVRLGAGLWTLRRWTRSGSEVECSDWPAALERAKAGTACRRDVRLLVSDVPAPLSWGWLNPVILLDRDTVRDPADADAIIAHEAAHVVRGDWLVLMLARLAVALFWFNPLMWLLERRIVGEAEEAADARALEHVEPARYAQVLLSCAQHQSMPRLPASGMADAGLGRRVRTILERRLRAGTADPRWIRAAMILAALVAAPIAALKPVVAVVRADAPPAAAPPPIPAAVPSAPDAPVAPPAPLAPEARAVLAARGIAPPPPAAPPVVPAPPPIPYRAMAAPPVAPAPPARLRPLVDGDEIARDVQAAIAEAMRDKDEALREAAQARAEALREGRGAMAEEIRRAALEAARRGMAEGARGMEEGARGMEEGADHLEREAAKLGSRDYRERQIARAARDGKALTHQQLLDMIPRFRESAEGMRRGAAAIRRNAEKMRRQG